MCGQPLDMRLLDMPTFVYASREDHIVPWESAYGSTKVLQGPIKFRAGASGHCGCDQPPARTSAATGPQTNCLPPRQSGSSVPPKTPAAGGLPGPSGWKARPVAWFLHPKRKVAVNIPSSRRRLGVSVQRKSQSSRRAP